MIETKLQNFDLNAYKDEVFLYKSYINQIKSLGEIQNSLIPSFKFIWFILTFLIFGILILYGGGLWSSFVWSLLISIYSIPLYSWFFSSDFFVNIISSGKLNDIKKEIQRIEELKDISYKKLQSFEEIIRSYFENQLDRFFEENLYKKRSGTQQFEESILEFSSMIKEISDISLITTGIPLEGYRNYVIKRMGDHNYQSVKKTEKLDSIRNLVQKISKNTPEQPKEVIAPEKLYRVARKVDNWDEINKKRNETGVKGEEIAVLVEQNFLESIGRKDLAQKVLHTSIEDGDGLGYDILSFFENGKEKYIEVKSTTTSLSSPFYISRNEVSFLREHKDDAFIYRILISESGPQIISYSSSEILGNNELVPVQYLVKMR